MPFISIATLEDLWEGELRHVHVNGHDIVLVRTANQVAAYEDKCPHLGFALSQGKLEGATLTCAAHAWQFDAECGAGINPCEARLRSYAVEIRDGDICVEITPESA